MENEMIETQEKPELELARLPNEILDEAQKAAKALQSVISKKKNPVMFNGHQYLEFEDWQTVAKFYGITVKVVTTSFVEYGEVKGFESRAVAIHVPTGKEISAAESVCLNDENNWKSKPLFQLKSMAQTRACAKALRNVLSWVVVLAGYRGTPAEEMETNGHSAPPPAPANRQPEVVTGTKKSFFAAPEMFTSKKGKGYWKTYDSTGLLYYIFDEKIAAALSENDGYELTVEVKSNEKGTAIMGIVS